MTFEEFQQVIAKTYGERDSKRAREKTALWFFEEVGEFAEALRHENKKEIAEELADVIAWATSLASIYGVNLEKAMEKYAKGCPRCKAIPCCCPMK